MHGFGKIYVVGCGALTKGSLTHDAYNTLEESDIIVGYKKYAEEIKKVIPHKQFFVSAMKEEVERVKKALEFAKEGKNVSIISSGDSGIYAMAGLTYEIATKMNLEMEIVVVPGIPALAICAAVLGAPLMNDFAVISFSNLLTKEDEIEKRLIAFLEAGVVIVIYNPVSRGRKELFERLWNLIIQKRKGFWAGYVKNGGKIKEEYGMNKIELLPKEKFDMSTLIIVGNKDTVPINNKLVTKRGYEL